MNEMKGTNIALTRKEFKNIWVVELFLSTEVKVQVFPRPFEIGILSYFRLFIRIYKYRERTKENVEVVAQ